jgi:hypothetical protein
MFFWHGRRASAPPPTSHPLPSSCCCCFGASLPPVPCQTHSEAREATAPSVQSLAHVNHSTATASPPPSGWPPPSGSCPSAASAPGSPFLFASSSVHTSLHVLLDLLPFLGHLSARDRSRVSTCAAPLPVASACPFVAPRCSPLFCFSLLPHPEPPLQSLVSSLVPIGRPTPSRSRSGQFGFLHLPTCACACSCSAPLSDCFAHLPRTGRPDGRGPSIVACSVPLNNSPPPLPCSRFVAILDAA